MKNRGKSTDEPWRTVAVRETVAGDRAVRGVVRQETETCGGWTVRGSPRHEPNRGGSVQSVRTAAVCRTMVNTGNCIYKKIKTTAFQTVQISTSALLSLVQTRYAYLVMKVLKFQDKKYPQPWP